MNTAADVLNFNAKVVWVTGAGRGIGLEVARSFHALGAEVYGFDREFPEVEYPFATYSVDLADPESIASACGQVLAQRAGLDILVNVAGILRMGRLETLSNEDWQACLNVNVSAVFHLVQHVIPVFKQQASGCIVNVASNAAHVPRMDMGAYCASKAALQSLSHCLGLELAQYGVRCNLVSPGSTDTPMLRDMLKDERGVARTIAGSLETYKSGIPLRKLASPRDIANSVVFLASDLAGHITLQDLVVDGGASLSA
ncbi:2,3-dihydro-2,3-dihydroxybenzoate dehydrogenase [Teredinibacter haidensis]|uniref:2,3-dihydro-2,3-dihydroxybenzoate dehydrogenase n=1 Tax=Teredinibacter haidensis TaxID=2731755 RepID=UPI000948B45B|nr:2,3-dihydro-2,3-dihydroxybenzoate dehydrogenase [Teredinibacter haidensis]